MILMWCKIDGIDRTNHKDLVVQGVLKRIFPTISMVYDKQLLINKTNKFKNMRSIHHLIVGCKCAGAIKQQ